MPNLSQLVVNSNPSTYSFRNKIINGNFDIWQRGITFTTTANTSQYTADRWFEFGGVSTATTCERITLTYSDLPNFYLGSRVQRQASNTGTATIAYGQIFETVHTIPLAGKKITISFYARRGANFSSASNILQVNVQTGTGTNQDRASLLTQTWTGWSNALLQNVTLSTTFQRYTVTFTLPTTVTQLALFFLYNGVGTAGASDFFDITGIQLEEGTAATPFEQRPTAVEYSTCMRYYERCDFISLDAVSFANIYYKVAKRRVPDVTKLSGSVTPTVNNRNSQLFFSQDGPTSNAQVAYAADAEF